MKEQHGFIPESKHPKTDNTSSLHSFSNYDLVQRLAVGGMGEVYLARQRTAFNREVAVKIIRQELVNDSIARQRFLREAEMGSYLKHDHILPLLEFGEEQGRLFIVTPYIRGGTLAQRLERGSLIISEIHEIFSALIRAVSYLHKRGIVHRDLKPGNILLDKEEDGDRVYVRLIDFGIATAQGLPISSPAPLTAADSEVGTVAYMAPERLDGVAAPSNDIYSLGIILYVMLTGELPDRDNFQKLPAPLTSVISRCLATNPADRFATADDLLQAFERAYASLTSPGLPAIKRSAQPQFRGSTSVPRASEGQAAQSNNFKDVVQPDPVDDLPDARTMVAPPPVESDTANDAPATVSGSTRRIAPEATRATVKYAVNRRSSGEHRNSGEHVAPAISPATSYPSRGTAPRLPSSSSPAHPALTSGTVLPAIPGHKHTFDKTIDYDAPTMEIKDDEKKKKKKRRFLAASASVISPSLQLPKMKSKKKRRGVSLVMLLGVISVLVIGAIGAIGYFVVQNSNVANVTIGPRVKTVSSIFTFTAQPGLKTTNAANNQIPANVFTSSKSASLQGPTSGITGCKLAIFNCKSAVALGDISSLSAQLLPGLKTQINQDLNQQAHAAGVTTVGDVFYTDSNVTANPPLGSTSKTVTVTVTEQGSVEYFKPGDVQSLALQKLQGKLSSHYAFIGSTVRTGAPVVRSVDANGDITIAVAAAGAAQYQIPTSVLSDLQNHIRGKHLQDARSVISRYPDLDPDEFSLRLSYGDTVPTNIQQIKVVQLAPTNIPAVKLPTVPHTGA